MLNSYKALIDENNCIGCGKCVQVCPTDAIVGARKLLHTVLPQQCTACGHCLNVCPTDCIALATKGYPALSTRQEAILTEQKRQRSAQRAVQQNSVVTPVIFTPTPLTPPRSAPSVDQRKQAIADAIARVKAKKQL